MAKRCTPLSLLHPLLHGSAWGFPPPWCNSCCFKSLRLLENLSYSSSFSLFPPLHPSLFFPFIPPHPSFFLLLIPTFSSSFPSFFLLFIPPHSSSLSLLFPPPFSSSLSLLFPPPPPSSSFPTVPKSLQVSPSFLLTLEPCLPCSGVDFWPAHAFPAP